MPLQTSDFFELTYPDLHHGLLAQMIGRAVRSETDSAVTFVLDSQFEKFVDRNERILPEWWRAAIQWERKAA